MDVEEGNLLGKQRTEVDKLETSADFLEPRTVRNPAPTVSHEGEVIDAAMTASLATGPLFLSGRICASSKAKHITTGSTGPPPLQGLHMVDTFTSLNRLGPKGMTPKPRRTRPASVSTKPQEVGAPYKESHSKRFRDRVMDAQGGLSNDDRVLLLARDRSECMAELREKNVQIKRLEVTVRALRAQLARSTPKMGVPLAEDENFTCTTPVARLVDENNSLETRLREVTAQLSTWKRDARVAHLQELKTELAVYQAEVTRLSSTTQGCRGNELRRSCVESRLREAVDSLKAKDDVIQELRNKLSENTAALGRSLESAMRSQSTVEQLQGENRALCKELRMLRKASIELTRTREKLECARAELKEATENLHQLRRLVGTVGDPDEIFVIIKERDALLNVLREQNAREESQRLEFARQQADTKDSAEKCLQKILQEERALAREKEAQLRHSCIMWKERYERLAVEGATERDRLEAEVQAQKGRQDERQRELRLLLSRMPSHSSEQNQPRAVQVPKSLDLQWVKALTPSVPSSPPITTSSTSSLSKLKSPPSIKSSVESDGMKDRNSSTGKAQQQENSHSGTNEKGGREGCLLSHHAHLEDEDENNLSKLVPVLQGPATTTTVGSSEEDDIFMISTKRSPREPKAEITVAIIDTNKHGNEQDPPLTPLTAGDAVNLKSLLSLTGNGSPVSDVALMPSADVVESPEPSIPIRVKVPPPLPAVVPSPPADITSTPAAAADVGVDSGPSCLAQAQMSSAPESVERSFGSAHRSPAVIGSGLSDVFEDVVAEDFHTKNRYEEEDMWGTLSAAEDEESFTVHHVEL
ncbi:putative flagellum transition zone component [Trypanosoma rangeli]|uniref:Putative flagellum transition zone component n=1 Tax=Trypanosoma rangeli TaxID=5698 RepID=A0A422NA97_TRYRA|nr:putative flagellum transition zone component [Trypanosoma rangeli]RNF02397.1 putative flagellum transition zone component [Trypanosoma rangeli]|eukprot:RNF02397.1 putative flagellum transition zone component [Trypanosoma rangeli]